MQVCRKARRGQREWHARVGWQLLEGIMVGYGPRRLCVGRHVRSPQQKSRGTGESVMVLGREINDRGAVCAEGQVMIIDAALGDYYMDILMCGLGTNTTGQCGVRWHCIRQPASEGLVCWNCRARATLLCSSHPSSDDKPQPHGLSGPVEGRPLRSSTADLGGRNVSIQIS